MTACAWIVGDGTSCGRSTKPVPQQPAYKRVGRKKMAARWTLWKRLHDYLRGFEVPLCPAHASELARVLAEILDDARFDQVMRLAQKPPQVYYIRRADGAIKIGYSGDVPHRLQALTREQGCPLDLLATHKGGREAERKLHKRFAMSRLEGEWFAETPELSAHVRKVQARSGARVDAHLTEVGATLERALGV